MKVPLDLIAGTAWPGFSPASRIILIESLITYPLCNSVACFSPASRIILIERGRCLPRAYSAARFSPASRIILIESLIRLITSPFKVRFQSRKQDYFN